MIHSDSINLLTTDSVNISNIISDTISVVAIGPEFIHSTSATTEPSGSYGWISWTSIGLSICIVLLIWKITKNVLFDIQKMHQKLIENEKVIKNALEKIEKLNFEIKMLKNKMDSISENFVIQTIEPQLKAEIKDVVSVETTEQITKQTLIKYATLQSPDENGVLRFSERSMVEKSTPQKMFLIEIDVESGCGTYRINPEAKKIILNDLQMFQDFVKPFTFSGDSMNATIQDKTLGKIVKQGNFWVVEERLDIIIN